MLLALLVACDLKDDGPLAATGGTGTGAGATTSLGGGAGSAGGPPTCMEETTGYCAAWTARLRECGALDSGCYGGCVTYTDAAEACETTCVMNASCEAIIGLECEADDELLDCLGACIGEMPIACQDGTTWPYFYRCDGIEDCLDGEDESGCPAEPMIKCRNVDERILVDLECDGTPDCSDGSDEPPACSSTFTCDSTLELPTLLVCDGLPDCRDGADEPPNCGVTCL